MGVSVKEAIFATDTYHITVGQSELIAPEKKINVYKLYNTSTGVLETEAHVLPAAMQFALAYEKWLSEEKEAAAEAARLITRQ